MNVSGLPIRAKVAVACAALTMAAIVVFATGTLVNVYHEQINAADVELAEEAWHVSRIMSAGESARSRIQAARVEAVEPWVAFAVFERHGSIWRSNESLPEEVARTALPDATPVTVRHGDGSWRAMSFAIAEETVVVTVDLSEVHEIVLDLLLAYGLSLPLAGLVAGFGGWWVAGCALRPVRALTSAADTIRADNLAARVPVPGTRDDIAHLASVLNAMLARLENSFRQAERFVADASHELRTPLTIMRGEIEAVLRDESLSPGAEQRLISLQEETDRMERITGNLLLLARLDAGAALTEVRAVDLSALVAETCDDLEAVAGSREVVLETTVARDVVVQGDDGLLRRLVVNLLDNATKFNARGGRVRCTLETLKGRVLLKVSNTGPGIPGEMRSRVFERFFRADPARLRAGHGLGLDLAREIARAHGGDLVLDTDVPVGWTQFVASLPGSDRQPP